MELKFFDLQIAIPRSEIELGSLYMLSGIVTDDGITKITDDPANFALRFRALRQDCGNSLWLTEAEGGLFIMGFVCEASDPDALKRAADEFSRLCLAYLDFSARIVASTRQPRALRVRAFG